jgi:hypothetical protein
MLSFLGSLFGKNNKTSAARRPEPARARPSLEALEDRNAPALIANAVLGAPFVRRPQTGFVRVLAPQAPPRLPPAAVDCLSEFRQMNVTSPVTHSRGQGQDKFYVCHFTNSARNPHNLILVAAPAAFGGHLRHGDIVFSATRDAQGLHITMYSLNASGQFVTTRVS